jgi:COMPASS component BRE2
MAFDGVAVDGLVSSSGLPALETFPVSADTPDPDADEQQLLGRSYPSPTRTVGSVGDVQAYFTEAVQDASEYNTDYDDPADDGSSRGGDLAIDEELARLA